MLAALWRSAPAAPGLLRFSTQSWYSPTRRSSLRQMPAHDISKKPRHSSWFSRCSACQGLKAQLPIAVLLWGAGQQAGLHNREELLRAFVELLSKIRKARVLMKWSCHGHARHQAGLHGLRVIIARQSCTFAQHEMLHTLVSVVKCSNPGRFDLTLTPTLSLSVPR